MTEIKKFNCPICNAGCGLLVEVKNNKIISVRADPNYPLTGGYCCPKGIALDYIANDKDRVLYPLKREGKNFIKISWKQALEEISDKIQQIIKKSSPQAIAYYLGTNSVHQYAHSMFAVGFMKAINSKNMYNAGSVDNNNKFVAQYFLYGSSAVMPIPDLNNTDLLILIGTNPAVTNLSLVTCSNVMKVLKDIIKRNGEIYLIDPRRNETAKILFNKNDKEHYIPIYPDTDIYLLLSMINCIFKKNLQDEAFLKKNTINYEYLKKYTKPFTLEIAEKCTGIPAQIIHDLTIKFAKTKRAVIYGRLGTCLSSFATLNAWAIELLNIICGKLDRPGGAIFGKNIINIAKLGSLVGMGGFNEWRSRIGNYPSVMGALPLGTLAREILADRNPVKALIISGGNPILSAPNSNEFKKALEKLELCIVLDFYINETAMFAADYILPTRTPMENSNLPIYLLNYQIFPHIEYSHRVIEPNLKGPKSEWEILLSLVRLLEKPMFGSRFLDFLIKMYSFIKGKFDPDFLISLFLFLGQIIEGKFPKLSLKKLKKSGTIVLGNNEYNVLKKYIRTKDKKIRLLNDFLIEQLKLCKSSIEEKIKEIQQIIHEKNVFLMIGRRNLKTMNSWMHNVELLWKRKQEPKLYINSNDANKLELKQNEKIIVENKFGKIVVPVFITDDILENVVCYPHGWGHKNPFLSLANQHPGENVNVLTDSSKLDKLSGQPIMNGYKVFLRKLN